MTDVHALSGAYAVHALDEFEQARFERHLTGCAECRTEVQSLREAAAALGAGQAVEPPTELRARVLDQIRTVRPLPPVTAETAQPTQTDRPTETAQAPASARTSVPRRGRARVWLAGIAAAVLTAVGVAAWQPWQQPEQNQPVAISDRVINAADAQRVSVSMPGGGTATAVNSRSVGRAVVITKDMPALRSGTVYQLWLQNAQGSMEPAGLMSSDGTKTLTGDSSTARGIGITVEPAGGSPAPTSDPVALFELSPA